MFYYWVYALWGTPHQPVVVPVAVDEPLPTKITSAQPEFNAHPGVQRLAAMLASKMASLVIQSIVEIDDPTPVKGRLTKRGILTPAEWKKKGV